MGVSKGERVEVKNPTGLYVDMIRKYGNRMLSGKLKGTIVAQGRSIEINGGHDTEAFMTAHERVVEDMHPLDHIELDAGISAYLTKKQGVPTTFECQKLIDEREELTKDKITT